MLFSAPNLHGAYRRADVLRECGRRRLDDALRTGVLHALWPRVVVDGSRVLDVRTRAAAALLTTDADAVICGPQASRCRKTRRAGQEDLLLGRLRSSAT